MNEKILTNKKNGMLVLVLCIALLLVATAGIVVGAIMEETPALAPYYLFVMIPSLLLLCFGWLPLCGLRVLKPQEALVLTLFGKYVGTLKGEGFYAVHPFCSAVNPAAKTKLNQSLNY